MSQYAIQIKKFEIVYIPVPVDYIFNIKLAGYGVLYGKYRSYKLN